MYVETIKVCVVCRRRRQLQLSAEGSGNVDHVHEKNTIHTKLYFIIIIVQPPLTNCRLHSLTRSVFLILLLLSYIYIYYVYLYYCCFWRRRLQHGRTTIARRTAVDTHSNRKNFEKMNPWKGNIFKIIKYIRNCYIYHTNS